jgi:hypothetical protein
MNPLDKKNSESLNNTKDLAENSADYLETPIRLIP